MGWWRTDFCSEFGGEDLLQQLLPHTWPWATLQSVREAGMRADSQLRTEAHDADVVLSLYNLGFTVNERLDERFQALKKSGQPPTEALPALKDVISAEWNQDNFQNWVKGHGEVTFEKLPTGRRVRGKVPESIELLVHQLIAGLVPFTGDYPMPHFRREL